MVGPWIHYIEQLEVIKGRKLSDIEFLSIKEKENKRADANDQVVIVDSSVVQDVVSATAIAGKDMYLGGARWSVAFPTGLGVGGGFTISLVVNGITVEQLIIDNAANNHNDFFLSKGNKVLAGEIIKITAKHNISAGTSVTEGKLILWEEDTGETPQIPSI